MELSEYVCGVIQDAVKQSERISMSDMIAATFAADGWEKAFKRAYRVRSFKPTPVNETLIESLAEWLGEAPAKEAADALIARLGAPVAVFRAEKEDALLCALSGSHRRFGAFYTTEDAFFAVFETHAIAFLMGNFD